MELLIFNTYMSPLYFSFLADLFLSKLLTFSTDNAYFRTSFAERFCTAASSPLQGRD